MTALKAINSGDQTRRRNNTMIDEKDVRNGIVTFAVLIVLPAFAAGLAVGWAVWGR